MKDQKPSLAGPCGVERDTERKRLIYEQSEMVPIPLTFVTFIKLYRVFICCVWFYSVKPINNKTGMENKTYLEVSDDDLLAQGITFEKSL